MLQLNTKLDIKSIVEKDFYIRNLPLKYQPEIKKELLAFSVNLNIQANKKTELLTAFINVTINYNDEQWLREIVWPELSSFTKEQIELLLHLTFNIEFDIHPFPTEDVLVAEIQAILSEICISTARGILFEKTRGTAIGSYPLPYVNAQSNK